MKTIAVLIFVLMVSQDVLFAQSSDQSYGIQIMATVVEPDSVDAIGLKIGIGERQPEDASFLPQDERGGVLIISGLPYSKFKLDTPAGVSLSNQYGEEAVLHELQLLTGGVDKPERMEVVSPSGCSEVTIPESGQVYVRIGGRLEAEEHLRGIYMGTLNLKCGNS